MATPGTGSSRLQPTLQSAVQAVQWTYSLFWQFCPQQGMLVWSDGYYNGAIKTRKTVQPMEVTAEEASLQRSQQLRELYDSLSAGETNQPARRPCAALSPEDLTESEWFYLMCVSFSFPTGSGLPGKAYAKRQYVWLTGANEVDSKVFSRAILAKSARVQTVVCIPLMDGVVELGTTDRVQEDPSLVQKVITFFADHQHHPPPKPALSGHSTSNPATATSSSNQPSRFNSPPVPAANAAAASTATTMYAAAEPTAGTATNNPAGNLDDRDVDEDEEEEEDLTNDDDDAAESDSEAVTGRNSQLLPPPPAGGDPNTQHQSVLQMGGGEGGPGGGDEPSELMQLEMSEDIRLGSPDDASNNLDSSDFPAHRRRHVMNGGTATNGAGAATLTGATGMLSYQRRGDSGLKSLAESGRRWPSAVMQQQQQQQHTQYDVTAAGQLAAAPSQHLLCSDIALGDLSQDQDTHYSQTVSVILQYQSNRWAEPSTTPGNGLLTFSPNSAFSKWTTRSDLHLHLPTEGTSQWLLKYILFTVPFLHSKHKPDVDNNNNIASASPKSSRDLNDPTSRLRNNNSSSNNNGSKGGGGTPQDELSANHVLAERRRREKLNERFIILRSLVPFVTKMDKASILGDTIEYVKQLRRKIQDLETHTRQMETERVQLVEAANKSAEIQRSNQSHNSNKAGSMADQTTATTQQWPSSGVATTTTRVVACGPSSSTGSHDKRKIRVVEGSGGTKATPKAVVEPQQQQQLADMLQVSIIESDALIELQCPYKEGLLLDVMLVLREMRVEVTGVQSSFQNGSFTAELRAKVKENVNGKKASIVEVKRAINQIIPQTDSS